MSDGRLGAEKVNRFINVHGEDLSDGFSLPKNLKCLSVVTKSAACFARNLHVRQEIHFNGSNALPFAKLAASAFHIERKARYAVASGLSLIGACENTSDGVQKANVGGRTRTRCFTNRRLIHL